MRLAGKLPHHPSSTDCSIKITRLSPSAQYPSRLEKWFFTLLKQTAHFLWRPSVADTRTIPHAVVAHLQTSREVVICKHHEKRMSFSCCHAVVVHLQTSPEVVICKQHEKLMSLSCCHEGAQFVVLGRHNRNWNHDHPPFDGQTAVISPGFLTSKWPEMVQYVTRTLWLCLWIILF